jgi:hypothetical protein
MMKNILRLIVTGSIKLMNALLRFVCMLVVIIIFLIAVVADNLHDEEEPREEINFAEETVYKKEPKTKESRLLDWTESVEVQQETPAPVTAKGDNNEVSQEEAVFNRVQANLEAHYKNSFQMIYPNANVGAVCLSEEEFDKLKTMVSDFVAWSNLTESSPVNNTQDDGKQGLQQIFSNDPTSPLSPGEMEFRRIISEIREGDSISIYSPVTSETESISPSDRQDTSEAVGEEAEIREPAPKKPVVIVTRRVEEGEEVPALPMWSNIPMDHQDYSIRRRAEIRRFFSDMVPDQNRNDAKPSEKNQNWMESEESYNLDNLFLETDKEINIKDDTFKKEAIHNKD